MYYEKRLTAEENILLELIANGESESNDLDSDCEIDKVINWNRVYHESKGQAVSLLAFDSVKKYEQIIPTDIYEDWFMVAAGVISTNLRIVKAQADLVNLLVKNGVKYVILKGCAAAEYYSKPDLRSLGDVDVLIDKKDLQRVSKLLSENEYDRHKEENECHVVFEKQGVNFEIHFEISGVPYGVVGDKVREYMIDLIASARLVLGEFGEYAVPQPEHHAVILLLHMQHHMLGEGMGLRHLYDWGRFVKVTLNNPFWKEKLIPFLKDIGLFTYAKVMTKTCAIYLNGALPNWANDVPTELCEDVITDIFKSGNFGRKNKARAAGGALVSEHGKAGTKHGKIYNAFKFTHRVVITKYPFVKKVFILYPFLYVYKIVKYLTLRLFGKRPSLTETVAAANERKAVYDKLHVFEIENER